MTPSGDCILGAHELCAIADCDCPCHEENPVNTLQNLRTDEQRVDAIITTVRAAYPTALSIEVTSSDQGSGGYLLTEVHLSDLTIDEGAAFDELEADVEEDLSWLRWGVFGDRNEDSTFTVNLSTKKIVRS